MHPTPWTAHTCTHRRWERFRKNSPVVSFQRSSQEGPGLPENSSALTRTPACQLSCRPPFWGPRTGTLGLLCTWGAAPCGGQVQEPWVTSTSQCFCPKVCRPRSPALQHPCPGCCPSHQAQSCTPPSFPSLPSLSSLLSHLAPHFTPSSPFPSLLPFFHFSSLPRASIPHPSLQMPGIILLSFSGQRVKRPRRAGRRWGNLGREKVCDWEAQEAPRERKKGKKMGKGARLQGGWLLLRRPLVSCLQQVQAD